jgi:hypothetical protein
LAAMNSTPAASSVRRMAFALASVMGGGPSCASARRMVATPRRLRAASSYALHRSTARAARICAPAIGKRADFVDTRLSYYGRPARTFVLPVPRVPDGLTLKAVPGRPCCGVCRFPLVAGVGAGGFRGAGASRLCCGCDF